MKTCNNTTPAPELAQFGPLAALFAWIDHNPRTSSALLWLMAAALFYFVLTYNFTTTL